METVPDRHEAVLEARDVFSAQVKQLYAQSWVGWLGALVGAVMLTGVLWNEVPRERLTAWLSCYVGIQLARYWLASSFKKAILDEGAIAAWHMRIAALTIASGFCWGMAGVLLFPANSLAHQFVLALFISGISAAAAVVYAPTWCYLPTILAELLPISGRYLYEGDAFHVTVAAAILLFAAVLVCTGKYMHDLNAQSLELRFEKNNLINFLTKEKARAEVLNELLRAEILERARGQEALREREETARALLNATTDAAVLLDTDGIILSVNDVFAKRVGLRPADLLGTSIIDLFSPENVDARRAWGEEVIRTGQPVRFVDSREGDYLDNTVYPIFDSSGRVEKLAIFSRDITERKLAQEALLESENKFRVLVEAARDVIWTVNIDFQLTYISPSITAVLGYTPEEIYASNPLDTFEPWSKERLANSFAEALRLEKTHPMQRFASYTQEVQQYHKDGSIRWMQITTTFLRDNSGEANGILGIARDVTEQKLAKQALRSAKNELELRVRERTAELVEANEQLRQEIADREKAENALRQSEQRFRALFETAQDCIFVKDADLRYSHVNPSMLRHFGLEETRIIGKTDEEIFSEHLAEDFRHVDSRVLDGQIIESEHTVSSDIHRLVFNFVKVPIKDAAGTVIGVYGIARDITERKRIDTGAAQHLKEGPSPTMRSTLSQARLAAGGQSIVLLVGESGSGKDYLARFIHDCSNRAGGPYFTINCAALPPELAESELFGYESGAFTGARSRKRGLLELAEGGTLLLNEIGELSLPLQAKLLTFLDTQTFTRVGGERSIAINARLIAATNRDLELEVESRNFRRDLFYRLNVFCIRVPSLRERIEDLPVLVEELLKPLADKMGLHEVPVVDYSAVQTLSGYHWPGNIRELRNVLERALILCDKKRIVLSDLGVQAQGQSRSAPGQGLSFTINLSQGDSLQNAVRAAQKSLITEGLRLSSGSIKDAATRLRVTRDQLKYMMKSLGISRR
jgi:PAS domain S-box-containing protein